MSVPRIVSAGEWLAERKELLAAEDQAAAVLAEVGERRRKLPAVRVEKHYLFGGPAGTVSLLDMFEGRRQLIVQHFMFDPAWEEGCPVCSYQHHLRRGVPRAGRHNRAVPAADGLVVPVVLVGGQRLQL